MPSPALSLFRHTECHDEPVLVLAARVVSEGVQLGDMRWNPNPAKCVQNERDASVTASGQVSWPDVSKDVVLVTVEDADNRDVKLQLFQFCIHFAFLGRSLNLRLCLVHLVTFQVHAITHPSMFVRMAFDLVDASVLSLALAHVPLIVLSFLFL